MRFLDALVPGGARQRLERAAVPAADPLEGVRLRCLDRADGDAVQQFVAALSPASRYRRFFTALRELPPAQLAAVIAPADPRDIAIGAFVRLEGYEHLAALAQCSIACGEEAEIALVVADAWQGRGLGDRLLARLIAHAERQRVGAIHGSAFADNWPMLALAAKHGFDLYEHEEPGLMRMRRALRSRVPGCVFGRPSC